MSTTPSSCNYREQLLSERKRSAIPSQRRSFFSTLTVFTILILAFANVGFIPTQAVTEFQNPTEITRFNAENLSYQPVHLSHVQGITSTLAFGDLRPPHVKIPPVSTAPVESAVSQEVAAATENFLGNISPAAEPIDTVTTIEEPDGTIKHVVIISIDGMRPDALSLADTPNIDKLVEKGAYNPKAQTVSLSITLPSHASMLSGMPPEKHGIVWGIPYIGWPGMEGPTLFSVAHNAGFSTAMVAGKKKFDYLVLPNSVDKVFAEDVHDPEVRDEALEFIEEGLTDILFVHFPDTDRVGHAYGWMSENQIFAISYADGLVGEIVAALEDEGYMDNTLLILSADHGGHGFGHGDDAAVDRTIPWLAVGPGVPQGVTLNNYIYTLDTAATALYALDIPIPDKWEGKPVLEIFE